VFHQTEAQNHVEGVAEIVRENVALLEAVMG
jgi:hypothetical protein